MPRHRPKPPKDERREYDGRVRLGSGEFRGRMVDCPQTGDVRPMLSRTRESMLNVLHQRLQGAVVWDCFAGSGLLGLECISRGAKFCVFLERDARHARVVQGNIDSLGVASRSMLFRGSIFDLVRPGAKPLPHAPADIVLLDPPHAMIEDPEGPFWPWLATLHETPLWQPALLVAIGHPGRLEFPADLGALAVADRREHGNVGFTLLQPA